MEESIYKIFNECLTNVDVTIFDYFQLSRAEGMKVWWSNEQEIKKVDRKAYYEAVRKRKQEAEERFKKNGHRRY